MKYNDLLDMPIPKVSVMITLDKVFEGFCSYGILCQFLNAS